MYYSCTVPPICIPLCTHVDKGVKNGTLVCTVGGNADWCATMGNNLEAPEKIKNVTAL